MAKVRGTWEGSSEGAQGPLPIRAAPTLAAMDFWRGWPYPVAVAALFVIVMLRAGGTYAIGRAAQEGVRRSRLSRVMAKPRFARMQQLVARWGAPVVALSFLTVGIQTLVNLAAGVMRMPLRRYLPALTVGAILWAFLYATVGFATFAGWRRVYGCHRRSPLPASWCCWRDWQATSSGKSGIAMMRTSAGPLTLGRDQPVCA